MFDDKRGGFGWIEDRQELQTERKRSRSVEVSRRSEMSSMRSFGRWIHSSMVVFSRETDGKIGRKARCIWERVNSCVGLVLEIHRIVPFLETDLQVIPY